VNKEVVNTSGLDGDLTILWSDALDHSINIDAHDAVLDLEVFSLELVEVWGRALRSVGTIDELPQILRNGPFNSMAIGLAKEKAASGGRFKKLSSEETAESVVRWR
jgi:hypothetical protein